MSHALEQLEDGSYAWWFDGKPAWHKIANNADAPEDITDLNGILKACRADWEVNKIPAMVPVFGDDGLVNDYVQVPDRFFLGRSTDNRILGRGQTVGKGWSPVQNAQVADFFQEFVEVGDLKMETAGVLDDGDRFFMLARVNDSFETVKGDQVKAHLLVTTHHQFGQATDFRFVAERVVCANTHAMAMREDAQHQVSLNHSRKFDPAMVKATLGIGAEIMAAYKEKCQALANARYTEETLTEFADELFPILGENKREKKRSRNAERLLAYVENQPGADFAPGTFWNAYNAVTFMADHVLGRTADSRLSSAWYGSAARTKQKALKLALDYAQAA